jgi:hypothetical protein
MPPHRQCFNVARHKLSDLKFMRRLIISIFLFLAACNDKTQSHQRLSSDSSKIAQTNSVDTIKGIWIDRFTQNRYPLPDSINGKPASFYLNNKSVAPIAKALYENKFRPSDNDSTTELLSLVTTDDSIFRPFYRWCLDLTISISDGALAEYPGEPALKYATKFPQEFFVYMDKDKSEQRYKQWTEIIAYSGLDNYEEKV